MTPLAIAAVVAVVAFYAGVALTAGRICGLNERQRRERDAADRELVAGRLRWPGPTQGRQR
jgi:hypothetical protein